MATQIQFRRGTTSGHSSFTGAAGELTIDTDKDTIIVHDGSTTGGANELVTLSNAQTLTNKTLTSPNMTSPSIGGTAVTATAAELNTLDGITATVSELNIMDGVTATASELNTLDGITATVTELNYSDGVTSNIQTQIDGKLDTTGGTISSNLTVTGNLTVNGTTVTNSATNTTIEDALIELGSGNSGANSNDLGLILERGSTGDNGFIGFDESADKFVVGTTTATGSSTGDLIVTTGTLLANIEGNVTGDLTGDVTGNLTGNAATATGLSSSVTVSLSGDVSGSATFTNGGDTAAITAAIAANTVGASELNVTGNGTAGQYLASDGDGTMTWTTLSTDPSMGGDISGTASNAQIVANAVGASELNVLGNGTAGQYLASDGDGSMTWTTLSTDPSMGGDLSGTASNAQIAAGAVGTTELAADCVTAAKIADDVINSEHYAAGSIDNEHIANNTIQSGKLDTGINGYGTRTVSTAAPSGGSNGDVWYKY